MIGTTVATASLYAAEGAPEEFHAPGKDIFNFDPVFHIGNWGVTKPMLLAILAALIVVGLFYAACANPKMVPGKVQSLVELGYLFVRDEIARSIIGKKGDKWVPLLVSLFFFVWIMNLFSVIPLLQFPVTSRIAYPAILAIGVYILFVFLGIKTQGPVGYFKNMMFPPGIPKPVYVLLAPIEFISTMLVRPFTHAVRLFANMFAGHVLIAFFSITAWHFLVQTQTIGGVFVGIAGFIMTIAMTGFEMFIQALQAFIFALLAAVYIQSSVEVEH
jgi:F-type H+-transporting ATPase subunit a